MGKGRYSIVFNSLTGNTKKLADTIYAVLPKENCDYFGAPKEGGLYSEMLYIGFWTDKGNADKSTLTLLSTLKGKKIFLFGTAGFGGFFLPPLSVFFQNGMGHASFHEQCIVVVGLIRSNLRTQKSRLNIVRQHLFQRLSVFLVHTEKERREHNSHHAEGGGSIATRIPENEKQRHSNQCRRSEADELSLCQVESYF